MGIWMSRLMSYFGEKEARILVLGLDNAGKTTILCEWDSAPPPAAVEQPCAVLTLQPSQDHTQPLCQHEHSPPSCLYCPADRLQVGEVVSTIPSESQAPTGSV